MDAASGFAFEVLRDVLVRDLWEPGATYGRELRARHVQDVLEARVQSLNGAASTQYEALRSLFSAAGFSPPDVATLKKKWTKW